MNFYKHFIGDYQRDTGHLSLMEHGAYRLMLDTFYATQKPLPGDRRTLYRLLRAEGAAERKAIDSVASQFWSASEKGLVNPRAETEIGKAQKQAEVNRQIAHAREEKKRLARQGASPDAGGNHWLSDVSGGWHDDVADPENEVYGVSRADGISMAREKQAINGVNCAESQNKDAFMAMPDDESVPEAGAALPDGVPGEGADERDGTGCCMADGGEGQGNKPPAGAVKGRRRGTIRATEKPPAAGGASLAGAVAVAFLRAVPETPGRLARAVAP